MISKEEKKELSMMDGTYDKSTKKMDEEIDFTEEPNELREIDDSCEKACFENKLIEIQNLFTKKVIVREGEKFYIDYDDMILECPAVDEYFTQDPLDTIEIIKNEMKEIYGVKYPLIFRNLNYDEDISNIRVDHIGSIVKFRGIISNATSVHPLTTGTSWECPSCGSILKVTGSDEARRCSCGRRGGFKLIDKSHVDIQEMFVEENYDEIGDKAPKKVRVRLVDELCDKEFNHIIIPGNKIEIIGVVEAVPMPPKNNKTKEEHSEFRIHALQIKNLENEFDENITDDDIEEMERISILTPLKTLSQSIAPNIKGRDLEKIGVLLAMVRGSPKKKIDGRDEKDTIHILLVGDAGQGKTDITNACKNLHFKGIYADCIGMTEASLTATAEQDKLTGSWSLKPGLLVKGNNGMVILDEFDKAKEEAKNAMHTVMESRIVSINKAAINTILSANCTLLFCANPKNSRFDPDKSRSLVEQINLKPTILSRMDLIFVFKDEILEEQDEDIADSVLGLREAEEFSIMDTNLFRKYLKYIQKFRPIINREAGLFLKEKYKKVRQMSKKSEEMVGMPIVARHLKAMVRLAEAHAKLRMSNEVEMEDVKVAYNLFEESLIKLGLDNGEGVLDMARIGPGVTLKTKEKRNVILEFIKSKQDDNGYATDFEINDFAKSNGLDPLDVDKVLNDLRAEGMIFSPRYGKWKCM